LSTLPTELELMRRTASGDAAAFRALADLHLSKIMNFAYRMLHDRAEAEDVAQESFLRLWKEAGRFEGKAKVSTWLHTVAHNLCIDRLRRRREKPMPEAIDEARSSNEPGGLLDRKRTAAVVEEALAQLPERQRAAITLVHYQGLGNIEAAEVLGVEVEAIESLLARGRRALRAALVDVAKEQGLG
jgi:RNA polymerase sigma-70 factor, ECF subfamily